MQRVCPLSCSKSKISNGKLLYSTATGIKGKIQPRQRQPIPMKRTILDIKKLWHPFYKPSSIEQFKMCFTELDPANQFEEFKPFLIEIDENMENLCYTTQDKTFSHLLKGYFYDLKQNESIDYQLMKGEFWEERRRTRETNQVNQAGNPEFDALTNILFHNDWTYKFKVEELNVKITKLVMNSSNLFCEDIYLWLLDPKIFKSIENLQIIIDSITIHLSSPDALLLDHFSMIEPIILRIVKSFSEELRPTTSIMNCFTNLFESINHEFNIPNIQHCFTKFNPLTLQYLLLFFLRSTGDYHLNECKLLIDLLILYHKKIPLESSIIDYLISLNKKNSTHLGAADKLRYVRSIGLILNQLNDIKTFQELLPMCQSTIEIIHLLKIIRSKDNGIHMIRQLIPSVITYINNLSNDELVNSSNLCFLLKFLKDSKIIKNDKIRRQFMLGFAINKNYSMLAQLFEELEDKELLKKEYVQLLLMKLNERKSLTHDHNEYLREKFFNKYIIDKYPHVNK
ncbi:Aep1p NDAI_0G04490 [Naumovozyma dairenensis CBS 421]|uniref:ATPase expression protein 1 n=1 Tax=Naumovozyma dairenensis (strain ATCC 10597 / BCRC 20456 / CBS 421 / NBRC 0211 / NRRL Y-12639) TaxID=1071378 RepID=J7REB0_NAUDC|nr:hypothetical protein NDAI_0G04490 [Naumovozyma dairenensis CBS 421]CCK73434.1 hypothetical protein NDAI_0G04490 [Naumovozyma dairenensis CBS 421]